MSKQNSRAGRPATCQHPVSTPPLGPQLSPSPNRLLAGGEPVARDAAGNEQITERARDEPRSQSGTRARHGGPPGSPSLSARPGGI
jgi:hypothetical protein